MNGHPLSNLEKGFFTQFVDRVVPTALEYYADEVYPGPLIVVLTNL